MRFSLAAGLGIALGFMSGCMSPNVVVDRIGKTQVFAMIDSSTPTDGVLMNVMELTDAIIISDGVGGHLDGMLAVLKYLDHHPQKTIIIDGACASACTLLLSRPANVVFTENAVFRFHSASIREEVNGKFRYFMSAPGNEKMLAVMPERLKDWIKETDAFGSRELTDMDSTTARQLFPKMFVETSDIPLLEFGSNITISGEIVGSIL